jgi:SAM-dependent methyltransferase
MLSTNPFYDSLAPLYHLVYPDWEHSLESQSAALAAIIRERWGESIRTILDVSCGIGTQAIGLARLGYDVTGSDLSPRAIERAVAESRRHQVAVSFSICDMRDAYAHHHQKQFDLVISCDNSITHLLSDDEIRSALDQIYLCTKPGGGCLLTVRDYDKEVRGTGIIKPYGVRKSGEARYVVFQVWDFVGSIYDLAMYLVEDDGKSEISPAHVFRARYYAISPNRLLRLLEDAGFSRVERLDEGFYQPVLLGTRAD